MFAFMPSSLFITLTWLVLIGCAAVAETFLTGFVRDPTLDGFVCPVGEMVFEKTGVTETVCGSACHKASACLSTFYLPLSSTCTGCNKTYKPEDVLPPRAGSQYFAGCPSGWYLHGISCYKFEIDVWLQFDPALVHCQQQHLGSSLMLIESDSENRFVLRALESLVGIQSTPEWRFFWMGMRNEQGNWVKSVTNKPVTWFNWNTYEPSGYYNGTKEDCGAVFFSPDTLKWGFLDQACGGWLEPICEFKLF